MRNVKGLKAAATAPAGTSGAELFHHQARRGGKVVVSFRGIASGGAAIVETSVHPLGEESDTEALQRPFPFPSALQAERFVDEALIALEYLGCVVTQAD